MSDKIKKCADGDFEHTAMVQVKEQEEEIPEMPEPPTNQFTDFSAEPTSFPPEEKYPEVTNDLTPQIIRKPIEKIMVRYRMYPKLMISPLNSTKLFTHQQADQQTYNWQVLRKVFDLLLISANQSFVIPIIPTAS